MAYKTKVGISGTPPKALATIDKVAEAQFRTTSSVINQILAVVTSSRELLTKVLGEDAAKISGVKGGGGNRTRELFEDDHSSLNRVAA